MTQIKKSRIWACVGYPESLPIDWLDRLRETGLSVAISPLHDKDVDSNGEIKKPHYHIIFYYEGPTTYKNVKDLCDSLNMTIPIKLESLRGMYRYHIHLDNPDKYQYDDRDRILLNGFDSSNVSTLTKNETNKIIKELIVFIRDNTITEYSDLLNILIDSDLWTMFEVAITHTLVLDKYISSLRNKREKGKS